jgi:serine phosphatase RsbU (regulator of sigma subunit)
MTSLDKARQGKSAVRQIRAQMEAGVLQRAELDRLLTVAEEGFEQMVPTPAPMVAPERTAFTVVRGGQQ